MALGAELRDERRAALISLDPREATLGKGFDLCGVDDVDGVPGLVQLGGERLAVSDGGFEAGVCPLGKQRVIMIRRDVTLETSREAWELFGRRRQFGVTNETVSASATADDVEVELADAVRLRLLAPN